MDRPSEHAPKRALRACENCRERKVKCNGNRACCQQCAHLNLRCVYKAGGAAARSRANASSRGSVISRLKGNGSHSAQPMPLRSTADRTISNGTNAAASVGSSVELPTGRPSSLALETEFGEAFFRALVQPYDDYIYCVSPVVTAVEMHAAIKTMRDDPLDFQLVHAFGAVTMNLTEPNWTADSRDAATVKRLMDIAMSVRSRISTSGLGGNGVGGGGSLRIMLDERYIMAGIFLEICLMAFRRHDEAFLMLREAISLIQLLQVGKTRSSLQTRSTESRQQRAADAKRERLYWEAFIHERFLAIIEYYPIVLEPLEDSIAVEDETLPVQVREGFQSLIQLFCVIDHEFVSHWRRDVSAATSTRPASATVVTKEWIESKKRELDSLDFMLQPESISSGDRPWQSSLHAVPSADSPASQHMATENWTSLNTLQQADLVITRQWMLTLLWQLALSHCVLPLSSSSGNSDHQYHSQGEAGRTHEDHRIGAGSTTSPYNDHDIYAAIGDRDHRHSGPASASAIVPLSLSFPVRLSQQLRAVITQLGRKYIERHGSGIIQKLFEITTTFADVIVHVPVSGLEAEEREQRLRDFDFLLNFLREFARLDEVQARILGEKAELVRGVELAASSRQ
ncbi:hypothetical protein Micbo1qcDRAFT_203704 [Microdochium bolleyi]|uniref:Zn(2)-C6 fungal-type domain-containing protein n=1 Tax=Microdochium bolleyi TaxID=196109 RepID=A0A136J3F5_9PEZI|nr:hypothetical protein Micbo1qcDRAFT_203704 [Microdochium bolleyi]